MLAYQRIVPADAEYEGEKALRDRVLRRPLGLSLSADDVRGEETQIHWAALDEAGRVIGCVLLVPGADGTGRIRQMAVEEPFRGRGVGSALMARVEETARSLGLRRLVLGARQSAGGFYETLGYRVTSEPYPYLTIPHVDMEKGLTG
jgi:N-acetylglutamate synthase-like GNAT family acetyltransferase